jgi:hypothetical protein
MIGWMEIMKLDNPESEGVHEIEKDIERLRTISESFSKIGSVPELNDMISMKPFRKIMII